MRKGKGSFFVALIVILLSPALLLGQDQQSAPPSEAPGPAPQARRRGMEPPCFKQAGVSDETWQKIMGIHKTTHEQVVGICENSSLSASQKRDQIRQARRQTQQQVHDLLTPQQQDAVKACRQQRRAGHEGRGGRMEGGMRFGGGGDPCARIMRQQNKGQGGPPPEAEPQP